MTEKKQPTWLRSKNQFGEEVILAPKTTDENVLVDGNTTLDEEIDNIYNTISTIELTPGPQGIQGVRGERGAKGVVVSETRPADPEVDLWITPQFDIDHIIDLDNYYDKAAVDEKDAALQRDISTLSQQLSELINPLHVVDFTATPNMVLLGEVYPSIRLSWAYSREDIVSQQLDSTALPVDVREHTVMGSFSQTTSFKLTATGHSKTITHTGTVYFCNHVYWGASSTEQYTTQLFGSLTEALQVTRNKTLTLNAGEGEYLFYAYPARLGSATFKVGGFEGGFELIDTITWLNAAGYSESYYVYRSANLNLGLTTITIT